MPEIAKISQVDINPTTTTASLFGLPEGVRVLDTRAPITQDKDLGFTDIVDSDLRHWFRVETNESIGTPITEVTLAAAPFETALGQYANDLWAAGRKPIELIPVDPLEISGETIADIIARLNSDQPTKLYGMWHVRQVDPQYQVIPPDQQEFFNAKGKMYKYIPQKYLPEQIIIPDEKHSEEYADAPVIRMPKKLTQEDLDYLKRGQDALYIKAANWGMGGFGVARVATLADVDKFRDYLRQHNVPDQTILLEEPLDPDTGGSFAVVRNLQGEVKLLSVSKQINENGVRVSNTVLDPSSADPEYVEMISTVMESLRTSQHAQGAVGIHVFDTMRTLNGRYVINDPAQRHSASTTVGLIRHRILDDQKGHGVVPTDVVGGILEQFFTPGTDFNTIRAVLNQAGMERFDQKHRLVAVKSYDGGTNHILAKLALVTDDPAGLQKFFDEVGNVFKKAGIYTPWRVK